MSHRGCYNGSLDGVDYSSPVPVIGLYIAAGSLACLALMLYDVIVAGILPRKRWLPCMHFKLNSVTLTLLMIAAKVTVDLTTPMPSRWDQLAKLTGTAFICTSMGFLATSIGDSSESEGFTNMMALTILVVTIAVNIIIQLSTGVIVLFFVEHIIVLSLMFLLLLMLWNIYSSIKKEKMIDADAYRYFLTKGPPSLFGRLKLGSLYARCSNPQFRISTYTVNLTVGIICLGCAAVVIEASFATLILKKREFCGGVSSYAWTMPYIVIIQIITVLLGPFPVVVRCVALIGQMDFDAIFKGLSSEDDLMLHTNGNGTGTGMVGFKKMSLDRLQNFFGCILTRTVFIIQLLFASPLLLVRCLFSKSKMSDTVVSFGDGLVRSSKYRVENCLNDMIKLKNQVESSESLVHLLRFLSTTYPSRNLYFLSKKIRDGSHHVEVSSVSLVLVVEVAKISIPNRFLGSLLNAFHEAKEIIHYIDEALEAKNSESIRKLAYARSAWTNSDLSSFLSCNSEPVEYGAADLDAALETIQRCIERLYHEAILYDLVLVVDYIICSQYKSIEELYGAMENLFVDILHGMFAQLPIAIFNNLREAPPEEFERKTLVAMKLLLQIGSFDSQRDWRFPEGVWQMASDEDDSPGVMFTGALGRLRDIVLVSRNSNLEIIHGSQP